MQDQGGKINERMDHEQQIFSWCSGIYRGSRSLGIILFFCFIASCTSLKKATLVSGASLGAASVTSALSSGVTAPLLAGASTAFATSVIVDQTLSSQHTGEGNNMVSNCAPDNFWTLLGNIIEMGGWLLILVILIPMILGWILPGPLERKRNK